MRRLYDRSNKSDSTPISSPSVNSLPNYVYHSLCLSHFMPTIKVLSHCHKILSSMHVRGISIRHIIINAKRWRMAWSKSSTYKDMVADGLTKPLTGAKFQQFVKLLQLN